MDDILKLMWTRGKGVVAQTFTSTDGDPVKVIARGEEDGKGAVTGAEVEIAGVVHRGDVIIGPEAKPSELKYAVLQVCATPCEPLLRLDGHPVAQIVVEVPERLRRSVESLRSGASNCECALWIADLDPAERTKLMDDLMMERLERKCADIVKTFHDSKDNWEQTFHVTLLGAMGGGGSNKAPYMKLAERVDNIKISREKSSVTILEALLLGGAGLLEGCLYDDYIHLLRQHFEYLQNKFDIVPMRPDEWHFVGKRPRSTPVIRLVQLAAFYSRSDFLFDTLIGCRTKEDVHNLFNAEASRYWMTHYSPDKASDSSPKRLGAQKADLLGINCVVPMMFAYGDYTGKQELKDAAIDLLEQLPAENNKKVNSWTCAGDRGSVLTLRSAMDTQAILQLNNEYCDHAKCTECRVGRRIIKIATQGFEQ